MNETSAFMKKGIPVKEFFLKNSAIIYPKEVLSLF